MSLFTSRGQLAKPKVMCWISLTSPPLPSALLRLNEEGRGWLMRLRSDVVNVGGIGIRALNPVHCRHFGCTMWLTACACQNWYTHGHETWLRVLDTPSLLRHLAHETMHTQACCAGCVTAHTWMHCICTLWMLTSLSLTGRAMSLKLRAVKLDSLLRMVMTQDWDTSHPAQTDRK